MAGKKGADLKFITRTCIEMHVDEQVHPDGSVEAPGSKHEFD